MKAFISRELILKAMELLADRQIGQGVSGYLWHFQQLLRSLFLNSKQNGSSNCLLKPLCLRSEQLPPKGAVLWFLENLPLLCYNSLTAVGLQSNLSLHWRPLHAKDTHY